MSGQPPRDPAESLDFLAMAHYAVAALWAMVSLVPLLWIYVGFELAGASGLHAPGEVLQAPSPLATTLAVAVLVAGFAGGAVTLWGGRCLATRRRLRVASAAALVACLFVPFGTFLGLAAWSILQRPEVRARFAN
jgi:hypothetical protein